MPDVPPPQPPPVPYALPQNRPVGIFAALLGLFIAEPAEPEPVETSYIDDALARIAVAHDATTLLGELSRLPALSRSDWERGQKAVRCRMRELGIM